MNFFNSYQNLFFNSTSQMQFVLVIEFVKHVMRLNLRDEELEQATFCTKKKILLKMEKPRKLQKKKNAKSKLVDIGFDNEHLTGNALFECFHLGDPEKREKYSHQHRCGAAAAAAKTV